MAKITVTGLVLDVKHLESGKTAIKLSENNGTKEQPVYTHYDCYLSLSDKQKQYLSKGKIIEVDGYFKIVPNTVEEKTFFNCVINVFNFEFKGDTNPKEDKTQE